MGADVGEMHLLHIATSVHWTNHCGQTSTKAEKMHFMAQQF
jgi:hypothetical protein